MDVTPGEIVEHYVEDDETRVIGIYLEGGRDGERLVDALCAAREVHKPVVVLTGGLSAAGSAAAVSHTGALTGDRRVWQAISHATGCAVVERLEDFLGALLFAQRYSHRLTSGHPAPANDDVLVVGVGGGASVLATDACDRAGLRLAPVPATARMALHTLGYGAGTSVANPIEIGVGPAAPVDVFQPVLDAVLAVEPFPDILLHVNVQAYYSYGTADPSAGGGRAAPLCALLRSVGAALDAARYPASRVVMVTRNLDVAPGTDADAVRETAVAVGIPAYRTFDEAAVAITAGKQFARGRGVRMADTITILDPRVIPPRDPETPTYDVGGPIAGKTVGLRLDRSWRSYFVDRRRLGAVLIADGATPKLLWVGERVGGEGEQTRTDLEELVAPRRRRRGRPRQLRLVHVVECPRHRHRRGRWRSRPSS